MKSFLTRACNLDVNRKEKQSEEYAKIDNKKNQFDFILILNVNKQSNFVTKKSSVLTKIKVFS